MRFTVVFFDLDGTLVDNFFAVHECCNLVERDMGLPLTCYAKVRASVGGSIVLTMQRLVGPEKEPEAVNLYRRAFAAHWADGLSAMPGAVELLKNLKAIGVKCAVLTNKNEVYSRKIVERVGMESFLDDVIGTSEASAAKLIRKPYPAFTRLALARMNAAAEESLMVGDSPFDAEAAINAGMAAHLVATGSHSMEELSNLKVGGVHKSLEALGKAVFGVG
jgi:phosphoglycolate phosphatase